ncbi:hypothetical protein B7R87_25750 [Streptomyces tsukubensis]|nr:hypothetical protein B7R87_25750 [Streptomyces tsukubensis]
MLAILSVTHRDDQTDGEDSPEMESRPPAGSAPGPFPAGGPPGAHPLPAGVRPLPGPGEPSARPPPGFRPGARRTTPTLVA